MYIIKTSDKQKGMDISQVPVAWMPPKSQLPDKLEEHTDDVSGTFAVTGFVSPSGIQTRGMQTDQGKSALIGGAQTGEKHSSESSAVTGAQAARYAAKGKAWDKMREEYRAAQEKDAEAKKCKPWSKAIVYGIPDMWLCAGITRCGNKRECYMRQLEVWEEYWKEFDKICRDAVP